MLERVPIQFSLRQSRHHPLKKLNELNEVEHSGNEKDFEVVKWVVEELVKVQHEG